MRRPGIGDILNTFISEVCWYVEDLNKYSGRFDASLDRTKKVNSKKPINNINNGSILILSTEGDPCAHETYPM